MVSVVINGEVFCVLESKRVVKEWMELFPGCYKGMDIHFVDHSEEDHGE